MGFRLASYKKGSKAIGPIQGLPHLPIGMVDGALAFENYIRKTSYEPFDPETHSGVWKQLTVRTSSQGDLMLYVIVSRKVGEDSFSSIITSLQSQLCHIILVSTGIRR